MKKDTGLALLYVHIRNPIELEYQSQRHTLTELEHATWTVMIQHLLSKNLIHHHLTIHLNVQTNMLTNNSQNKDYAIRKLYLK